MEQLFYATSSSDSHHPSSKYSRWRDIKHEQKTHTNQIKQFCDQLDSLSQIQQNRKSPSPIQKQTIKDKSITFLLPRCSVQRKPSISINYVETKQSRYRDNTTRFNTGDDLRKEIYPPRAPIKQTYTIELPYINCTNFKNPHITNKTNKSLRRDSIRKTNKHQKQTSQQMEIKKQSQSIDQSRKTYDPPIMKLKTREQILTQSQLILDLISPKGKAQSQRQKEILLQQYDSFSRGYYRNQDYFIKYRDQKLFLQMSSKISKNLAINMQIQ